LISSYNIPLANCLMSVFPSGNDDYILYFAGNTGLLRQKSGVVYAYVHNKLKNLLEKHGDSLVRLDLCYVDGSSKCITLEECRQALSHSRLSGNGSYLQLRSSSEMRCSAEVTCAAPGTVDCCQVRFAERCRNGSLSYGNEHLVPSDVKKGLETLASIIIDQFRSKMKLNLTKLIIDFYPVNLSSLLVSFLSFEGVDEESSSKVLDAVSGLPDTSVSRQDAIEDDNFLRTGTTGAKPDTGAAGRAITGTSLTIPAEQYGGKRNEDVFMASSASESGQLQSADADFDTSASLRAVETHHVSHGSVEAADASGRKSKPRPSFSAKSIVSSKKNVGVLEMAEIMFLMSDNDIETGRCFMSIFPAMNEGEFILYFAGADGKIRQKSNVDFAYVQAKVSAIVTKNKSSDMISVDYWSFSGTVGTVSIANYSELLLGAGFRRDGGYVQIRLSGDQKWTCTCSGLSAELTHPEFTYCNDDDVSCGERNVTESVKNSFTSLIQNWTNKFSENLNINLSKVVVQFYTTLSRNPTIGHMQFEAVGGLLTSELTLPCVNKSSVSTYFRSEASPSYTQNCLVTPLDLSTPSQLVSLEFAEVLRYVSTGRLQLIPCVVCVTACGLDKYDLFFPSASNYIRQKAAVSLDYVLDKLVGICARLPESTGELVYNSGVRESIVITSSEDKLLVNALINNEASLQLCPRHYTRTRLHFVADLIGSQAVSLRSAHEVSAEGKLSTVFPRVTTNTTLLSFVDQLCGFLKDSKSFTVEEMAVEILIKDDVNLTLGDIRINGRQGKVDDRVARSRIDPHDRYIGSAESGILAKVSSASRNSRKIKIRPYFAAYRDGTGSDTAALTNITTAEFLFHMCDLEIRIGRCCMSIFPSQLDGKYIFFMTTASEVVRQKVASSSFMLDQIRDLWRSPSDSPMVLSVCSSDGSIQIIDALDCERYLTGPAFKETGQFLQIRKGGNDRWSCEVNCSSTDENSMLSVSYSARCMTGRLRSIPSGKCDGVFTPSLQMKTKEMAAAIVAALERKAIYVASFIFDFYVNDTSQPVICYFSGFASDSKRYPDVGNPNEATTDTGDIIGSQPFTNATISDNNEASTRSGAFGENILNVEMVTRDPAPIPGKSEPTVHTEPSCNELSVTETNPCGGADALAEGHTSGLDDSASLFPKKSKKGKMKPMPSYKVSLPVPHENDGEHIRHAEMGELLFNISSYGITCGKFYVSIFSATTEAEYILYLATEEGIVKQKSASKEYVIEKIAAYCGSDSSQVATVNLYHTLGACEVVSPERCRDILESREFKENGSYLQLQSCGDQKWTAQLTVTSVGTSSGGCVITSCKRMDQVEMSPAKPELELLHNAFSEIIRGFSAKAGLSIVSLRIDFYTEGDDFEHPMIAYMHCDFLEILGNDYLSSKYGARLPSTLDPVRNATSTQLVLTVADRQDEGCNSAPSQLNANNLTNFTMLELLKLVYSSRVPFTDCAMLVFASSESAYEIYFASDNTLRRKTNANAEYILTKLTARLTNTLVCIELCTVSGGYKIISLEDCRPLLTSPYLQQSGSYIQLRLLPGKRVACIIGNEPCPSVLYHELLEDGSLGDLVSAELEPSIAPELSSIGKRLIHDFQAVVRINLSVLRVDYCIPQGDGSKPVVSFMVAEGAPAAIKKLADVPLSLPIVEEPPACSDPITEKFPELLQPDNALLFRHKYNSEVPTWFPLGQLLPFCLGETMQLPFFYEREIGFAEAVHMLSICKIDKAKLPVSIFRQHSRNAATALPQFVLLLTAGANKIKTKSNTDSAYVLKQLEGLSTSKAGNDGAVEASSLVMDLVHADGRRTPLDLVGCKAAMGDSSLVGTGACLQVRAYKTDRILTCTYKCRSPGSAHLATVAYAHRLNAGTLMPLSNNDLSSIIPNGIEMALRISLDSLVTEAKSQLNIRLRVMTVDFLCRMRDDTPELLFLYLRFVETCTVENARTLCITKETDGMDSVADTRVSGPGDGDGQIGVATMTAPDGDMSSSMSTPSPGHKSARMIRFFDCLCLLSKLSYPGIRIPPSVYASESPYRYSFFASAAPHIEHHSDVDGDFVVSQFNFSGKGSTHYSADGQLCDSSGWSRTSISMLNVRETLQSNEFIANDMCLQLENILPDAVIMCEWDMTVNPVSESFVKLSADKVPYLVSVSEMEEPVLRSSDIRQLLGLMVKEVRNDLHLKCIKLSVKYSTDSSSGHLIITWMNILADEMPCNEVVSAGAVSGADHLGTLQKNLSVRSSGDECSVDDRTTNSVSSEGNEGSFREGKLSFRRLMLVSVKTGVSLGFNLVPTVFFIRDKPFNAMVRSCASYTVEKVGGSATLLDNYSDETHDFRVCNAKQFSSYLKKSACKEILDTKDHLKRKSFDYMQVINSRTREDMVCRTVITKINEAFLNSEFSCSFGTRSCSTGIPSFVMPNDVGLLIGEEVENAVKQTIRKIAVSFADDAHILLASITIDFVVGDDGNIMLTCITATTVGSNSTVSSLLNAAASQNLKSELALQRHKLAAIRHATEEEEHGSPVATSRMVTNRKVADEQRYYTCNILTILCTKRITLPANFLVPFTCVCSKDQLICYQSDGKSFNRKRGVALAVALEKLLLMGGFRADTLAVLPNDTVVATRFSQLGNRTSVTANYLNDVLKAPSEMAVLEQNEYLQADFSGGPHPPVTWVVEMLLTAGDAGSDYMEDVVFSFGKLKPDRSWNAISNATKLSAELADSCSATLVEVCNIIRKLYETKSGVACKRIVVEFDVTDDLRINMRFASAVTVVTHAESATTAN
jgi:hypothetical protein